MKRDEEMTNRERVWSILRGREYDRIPFMPFEELIPDSEFVNRMKARGMGFIRHCSSVKTVLRNVGVTHTQEGGCNVVTYRTPCGDVSEEYSPTKKKITGNLLGVQTGFMIKGPEDYRAALYLIENTDFESDPAGYEQELQGMGDNGIPHTWTGEPPYMEAQYYLGLEAWSYHQIDFPDEFHALLNALGKRQERLLRLTLNGPETLVNLGNLAGNFSPAKFEEYMLPYFRRYAPLFREKGKITTIHADANNLSLFAQLVAACGVDVVEAFTPPPFGDLTLAGARKAWGDQTTIWINFPESVFYGGYEKTRQFTADLLSGDSCGNKFIGLTEMGLLGVDEAIEAVFQDGIRAILDAVETAGVKV